MSDQMRILLVEDEETIAVTLVPANASSRDSMQKAGDKTAHTSMHCRCSKPGTQPSWLMNNNMMLTPHSSMLQKLQGTKNHMELM